MYISPFFSLVFQKVTFFCFTSEFESLLFFQVGRFGDPNKLKQSYLNANDKKEKWFFHNNFS